MLPPGSVGANGKDGAQRFGPNRPPAAQQPLSPGGILDEGSRPSPPPSIAFLGLDVSFDPAHGFLAVAFLVLGAAPSPGETTPFPLGVAA